MYNKICYNSKKNLQKWFILIACGDEGEIWNLDVSVGNNRKCPPLSAHHWVVRLLKNDSSTSCNLLTSTNFMSLALLEI